MKLNQKKKETTWKAIKAHWQGLEKRVFKMSHKLGIRLCSYLMGVKYNITNFPLPIQQTITFLLFGVLPFPIHEK